MGKKSNKRTHPATLSLRATGFHGGIKNSLPFSIFPENWFQCQIPVTVSSPFTRAEPT
jgi:hypothetical protein